MYLVCHLPFVCFMRTNVLQAHRALYPFLARMFTHVLDDVMD
jgi:hypothetical protein